MDNQDPVGNPLGTSPVKVPPQTNAQSGWDEFRQEFGQFWQRLPFKGLFFGLLGVWILLFHFLGNSTLGYVRTSSLFGWLIYAYENAVDDQHGYFIPLVVLALMWWKRQDLLAVKKLHWWPGLLLLLFALLIHVAGFMVQQTRVSVVAFFVGIYALMGLVWGFQWLKTTFFPFFLFAFCVPISTISFVSEKLTLPLRILATQITSFISSVGLGINVNCNGTLITDANGTYHYEVAATCSGIRSLTAIFALTLIYGFVLFPSPWKRLAMIASAFPMAVLANVVRLCMIIIAAETFGQSTGNYVHENGFLSMLPYVPAIGGVLFLGFYLKGKETKRSAEPGLRRALMSQEPLES